jgi:hypothetical protein
LVERVGRRHRTALCSFKPAALPGDRRGCSRGLAAAAARRFRLNIRRFAKIRVRLLTATPSTFEVTTEGFVTAAIVCAFLDTLIPAALHRIGRVDVFATLELRADGTLIWLVRPGGDLVGFDRVRLVRAAAGDLAGAALVSHEVAVRSANGLAGSA